MSRRTALFTANVSLVVLSLLTGLRILPGPDAAGIALAFYCLIILPGILLSDIFLGGAKADFEGISRIFTAGISAACLFVCTGFIPGVSYASISLFYSAVVIIALFYRRFVYSEAEREDLVGSFSRREDYSSREKKAMLLVFLLLFGICAALLSGSGETGADTDAPDHISFIRRSLESGEILPGDSFHREGDGAAFDPRKGLWHPVLSLWAWQADAEAITLWKIIPGFLAFFAIVVFWFFAGELSGSIPVKALSVIFLLLFFRGEGLSWLGKLSYSRNISQLMMWGASGFVIRYLRMGRSRDAATAAIVSAVGTAVHLSFAPVLYMFLFALLVYTAVPRWGGEWRGRFWKAAPLTAAAAGIPLTIRFLHLPDEAAMIHTHTQGMMDTGLGLRMMDPAGIIAEMGFPFLFALLLIPFFPLMTSGYRRSRMVWTLFSLPALLVLFPVTATLLDMKGGYMHFRLLYAAPVTVYLAIAVFGAGRGLLTGGWRPGAKPEDWKRRSAIRISGAVVFAVFTAVFFRPAAKSLPARLLPLIQREGAEEGSMERAMPGFLGGIPPGSVIASDPLSCYRISAYTDHFVTVVLGQHCSPSDTTALDRARYSRDIFSPAVSDSLVLDRLLSGAAEYLFINTDPGGFEDFFGVNVQSAGNAMKRRFDSFGFLTEIDSEGSMTLYSVDTAWAGSAQGIAGESGACAGAGGFEAGDGIVLSSFSTDSPGYSPGDEVVISVCWSVAEPVPFGLPFYWSIRFDTDFDKGPFYRRWFGKQYRRVVERRRGELYRFTASGRIFTGAGHPDQWMPGERSSQVMRLRLPGGMADGVYSVKISASRRPYLPNRHIRDYFLNDDSFAGYHAGAVTIEGKSGR